MSMHFLMSLPLNPFALARHVTCLGIMTMSPKFPMPSEYCNSAGCLGEGRAQCSHLLVQKDVLI